VNAPIEFRVNQATRRELAEHLRACDADFVPPLSGRVDMEEYSGRIATCAIRFEAWSGGQLVGLVAAYCNDPAGIAAYVTSVSVLRNFTGHGIGAQLLKRCVAHARLQKMRKIGLEVFRGNTVAIRLYEKCGFEFARAESSSLTMVLRLNP